MLRRVRFFFPPPSSAADCGNGGIGGDSSGPSNAGAGNAGVGGDAGVC